MWEINDGNDLAREIKPNPYQYATLNGEEIPNMITSSSEHGLYIVTCQTEKDLTVDKILRTMELMEAKLEIDCAAIMVKEIICEMSPETKDNLIRASKRLTMFGKKKPILARFDEYGNRLPDMIQLNKTTPGIILSIVNPSIYGDHFLSMRVVNEYVSKNEESIPF